MFPANTDQMFHEAMRLHHSGELIQAERLYRRLIKKNRDHPDLSIMYGHDYDVIVVGIDPC